MRLLLRIDISIRNAKAFRRMSVITYPLHASLAAIIKVLIGHFINTNETITGILVFTSTLLICLFTCYVIFKLEKLKAFKWLKYSH